MARGLTDQNTTGFQYESGTYATATGTTLQWIGQVTNHDIDVSTNNFINRYVGTGTRDFEQAINGPRDYRGTLEFLPQDWKLLGFALGSVNDTGSPSPYQHLMTAANSNQFNVHTVNDNKRPFMSFTVEDTHESASTGQDFQRTVNGCIVDTWELNIPQADQMTVSVEYIGQVIPNPDASGAATSITAATTRAFNWSDTQLHLPSGTELDGMTNFRFRINNNLDSKHYLNGSRDILMPLVTMRDYEVEITLDEELGSNRTGSFFDNYFLAGSTFNMLLDVSDKGPNFGTGSRDLFITFSGCKLMDMTNPTLNEGVNEQTLTIRPQTVTAIVDDTIELYNGW